MNHMKASIYAALVLVSLAADAQAQSFYLGLSAGDSVGNDNPEFSVGGADIDSSWRLQGGWRFADAMSLEASYHDFGTATAGLFPCPPQAACIPEIAGTDRRSTDAWSLRVAYRLGEDRWQPFASLGWVWSNTDGDYQNNISPNSIRYEESDNGLSAEVGVRALLGAGFAVRAGYEWFELDGGDGAVNLGVEYAF